MSGHSKWHQIRRSKGKVDAERGKLFSRLAKDIMSAARSGGGNPDGNLRLKIAIDNARKNNMPSDNIQRAILKGTGGLAGARLDEVLYEGYGPGGVAVMIEVVTDNRNRMAADLRHIFSKCGGNLGESGSVAWMFARQGVITVERTPGGMTEDDLLAVALEAGATDLKTEPDTFTITTAPEDLDAVLQELAARQVEVAEGKVQLVPATTVELAGEAAQRMLKLMDMLEDNDDVQNVYANFDIPESELAALEE